MIVHEFRNYTSKKKKGVTSPTLPSAPTPPMPSARRARARVPGAAALDCFSRTRRLAGRPRGKRCGIGLSARARWTARSGTHRTWRGRVPGSGPGRQTWSGRSGWRSVGGWACRESAACRRGGSSQRRRGASPRRNSSRGMISRSRPARLGRSLGAWNGPSFLPRCRVLATLPFCCCC